MNVLPGVDDVLRRFDEVGFATGLASRLGLFGLDGAKLVVGLVGAGRRLGVGPAIGYEAAAGAFGSTTGLIDDAGSMTFSELRDRSDALAVALGERGVGEGDRVAVLARNHRGLMLSTVALGKLGADAIFLNTGFAPPQAVEVCTREGAVAVVADAEFDETVAGLPLPRYVSWGERGDAVATLDALIGEALGRHPARPNRVARTVILTSGTTGTPKGASRDSSGAVGAGLAFLDRVPLRIRDTTLVAAPGFHAWGAAHLASGLLLAATIVLQRRFEPEAVLAAIERHRVRTLVVVPVMLQRIVDLPEDVRSRYDTSSLQVVASSGSALPGPLAQRWMDAFGDNLYNIYGSTEVSIATVANPAQLRATPGTAGTPLRGSTVALLDESGTPVPAGQTGRIFVGNAALFDGYTGGGTKEVIDGLMATGDVGHFDAHGSLLVEGRSDDMIVSGGENVFPGEVEDLLAGHPAIAEAAVVGVPDDEFGQRLAAFVVKRRGGRLSAKGVQDYVKAHLARHKVPRDVVFLEALPRNATGKIVRRELINR